MQPGDIPRSHAGLVTAYILARAMTAFL